MLVSVDSIKKNMASISAVVTFATVIIGGAFAVESRYAKAADIVELKTYVKQQHEYDRWENQQSAASTHKQQIEDQLFILRSKANPTQTDRALIQRYEDQLKEVTDKLNQAPQTAPADK
jgi:hypothetical protein